MSTTTESPSGSAERWGPLWGARPADWALSEEQQTPTYEAALERLQLRTGDRVLDIGCGVGAFLRLVTAHGAQAFGLDASEALLELARERVADADLRVGDMEALPYDDDTFDLVTGFNAFFFANDIVAALREAARVAKPGAPVVIQVAEQTFTTRWAFTFSDEDILKRALVAPMGIALLVGEREDEVKDAIAAGMAKHRTPAGGYRLKNEYRYLIARA
jgi:ubiquinone/menaquinone biosynthesis C-methylase UbiE